ncbi:nuclear transport factor 2 family protein [Lysobacter sp. S4-A87]|uniref:nuclear transport factor 2 family protein n=1 Tax=Lysobacter sp. S4-A87 TaxID=2925843 RepID=UPI001F52B578|nr:nuclear transport factor 2 family protein [Lysobacter sp. S4-A87]UNK47894.1 nuclear transport factor 2 family protein [Lysobacter sp. S4-A87]
MNKPIPLIAVAALMAVAAAGTSFASGSGSAAGTKAAADPLFDTISTMDTEVFGAFNTCSEPGQLQKHASYFAPDVEFYHDTGGVTWSRQEMLANTEKYVCGHFRRELVPGTLVVYPIKDFGAIEQGSHRFCQFDTGKCEGLADFLIVWNNNNGKWQITRVLSYGHRANK